MDLKLEVTEGPAKGSTFILSNDENTLGRAEESTACIVDKNISKRHGQVIRSGNTFYIIDLNSKNGLFLNGTRILPDKMYILQNGSEIKMGSSVMLLSFLEHEPDGEDAMVNEKKKEEDTITQVLELKAGVKPGEYKNKLNPKTITFRVGSSRSLATIYRIITTVGTGMDRDFLFSTTLGIIKDTVEPERAFVFLSRDIEKGDFAPRAGIPGGDGKKQFRPKVSKTAIRKVMERGDSILSTVSALDDSLDGSTSVVEDIGLQSVICVPIRSSSGLLGVLYIDTKNISKAFSSDDLELMSAVGIQLGTLLENRSLVAENQALFLDIVKTFINIIEEKDKYTYGHSERVTAISIVIAEELGWSAKEIEEIRISALLHDIGKVTVPEDILNKHGKLTEEEFDMIKRHPMSGRNFVKHMKKLDKTLDGIQYHHERYDGKGYPEGLSGADIPLIARVIAVADAYDAMTSDRSYRKSLGEKYAMEELSRNVGIQFDPVVVDAFLQAMKKGKIPG